MWNFLKIKKTSDGFTLIEILVVISMMLVLVSMSVSSLFNLSKKIAVPKIARQAVSLLDRARISTLSSNNNSQYGVHFDSTSMTLFKGSVYSSFDSNNYRIGLDSGITSTVSFSGGGSDIIFSKLTGNPNKTGTITYSSRDNSISKVVTIYATGVSQSL